MTADRDALAHLIRDTIRARFVHDDSPDDTAYISDDDPITHVFVDGYIDLRGIADAILAALHDPRDAWKDHDLQLPHQAGLALRDCRQCTAIYQAAHPDLFPNPVPYVPTLHRLTGAESMMTRDEYDAYQAEKEARQ